MNTNASKNVLAKILATENIMVRHDAKASTASFDLHKRVLTLPVWKNMTSSLMDMLIGHEVGHALYTPGMNPQQFMDFTKEIGPDMDFAKLIWNVVEDARIERMIKEEYPGLRRDFFHGYKEIYEMDMFEIEGKNINDLPFIDRMNLHFKIGPVLHNDVIFTPEEMVFIKRCEATRTHDDIKVLSKDIYDFINENNNVQNNVPELDDLKIALSDNGGEQTDYSEEFSYNSIGANNTSENETNEVSQNSSNHGGENQNPSHSGSKTADIMKNLEKNLNKNIANNGTTYICTIPEINLDRAVNDYKEIYARIDAKSIERACNFNIVNTARVNESLDRIVAKVKEDSMRSVTIMINQFNRKKAADQSRKSRINKTGKLNMDKLHQYKISEDLFLSRTTTKDGKNHGFLIFLDWSGSMNQTIHDVMMQLFQIAIFCRKVKIPFEVYSFSNRFFDNEKNTKIFDHSEPNSLILQDFCLNNLLSSRMSNTEFDHAIKIMSWVGIRYNYHKAKKLGIWGYIPEPPDELGMCTTPLSETMVAAAKLIPIFRQKHNLQIVNTVFMTDGDGDAVGYGNKNLEIGERYSLFDKITGISYEFGYGNRELPNKLIKMIKDRTGCNLIHFHLDTARRAESVNYSFFNGNETLEEKKNFNKSYESEGFFPAPNKNSFDEVFVMKSNIEIDIDLDDDKFLDSKKSSFTSLKTAFLKMNDRRITSRVLLNRFIDLVSA